MKYFSRSLWLGGALLLTVALFTGGCQTSQLSVKDTSMEYACPVCDTGYISEGQWVQHVKHHHKQYDGAAVAKVKQKQGHLEFEYGCPVCDTEYMTEAEWRRYAADNKDHKKILKPKVRARKTMKTSMGEKDMYACPVCDTEFLTEDQWRMGMPQK